MIKLERIKNIHYDGTITYSEEKEIDRKEIQVYHEKELINSRFDEKEERLPSKWEGKKEIITTKFLRRKILTYNDGSTEEGKWEEYRIPKIEEINHPKNLKDIKEQYQNFEEDGYKITQQKKLRIYDDGSTEEGEWETISKIEMQKTNEIERSIEKVITESKIVDEKDIQISNETKSYKTGLIFKDTHYYETQVITPIKKQVKYERTVTYYKDGQINYGDWRKVN